MSISGAPSSRWSTSICTEEPALSEVGPADLPSTKVPQDGESRILCKITDTSVQAIPPPPKDEDALQERSSKELVK